MRPFRATTISDTIAKILEREPDWAALPDATPVTIRRLLQRCLRKDPGQRLHDIADARIEIEEALGSAVAFDDVKTVAESRRPAARGSWRLLWIVGLLLAGVGLGFLASRILDRPDGSTPRPVRFVETLPADRVMPPGTLTRGTMVAVSSDGHTLVYSAQEKGQWRLFSRSLDQLDQRHATPIGDVDARNPFFSPDGQWIGFFDGRILKRVPARGGPTQPIIELPTAMVTQGGGSWNADGTILVGGGTKGLLRVSENGGGLETLVAPPEGRGIWYPQLLPGGRRLLYTESETRPDAGELMVLDLETRVARPLGRGAAGRYLLTGHLVYVAEGTLWGGAFDLDRLEMRGTPVSLIQGIRVTSEGGAVQLALAETGVIAYVPAVSVQRTLVWVDREGKETPVGVPLRAYSNPGCRRMEPRSLSR